MLRANLIESVPLIGMTTAYTMNATGAGQAVAVLDTGIKFDHEFLVANLVAEACFSNASPAANRVSLCPVEPNRNLAWALPAPTPPPASTATNP